MKLKISLFLLLATAASALYAGGNAKATRYALTSIKDAKLPDSIDVSSLSDTTLKKVATYIRDAVGDPKGQFETTSEYSNRIEERFFNAIGIGYEYYIIPLTYRLNTYIYDSDLQKLINITPGCGWLLYKDAFNKECAAMHVETSSTKHTGRTAMGATAKYDRLSIIQINLIPSNPETLTNAMFFDRMWSFRSINIPLSRAKVAIKNAPVTVALVRFEKGAFAQMDARTTEATITDRVESHVTRISLRARVQAVGVYSANTGDLLGSFTDD